MNLAFLALLPAALLIDRLFGELPSRVHPVCMMGALASRIEALFRRGSNNALMSLSGTLACLLVVLPCAALAGGLAWAAQVYADPRAAWFVSAIIIWICVAPRSLDEHALRVAVPLAKGDLEGARKAVSMMVGRNPDRLDAHGVARACVESVGENLTDGVLSTLFWAGIGLFFFGYPGAACLAVLHRSANVLDALWGKKNEKYIRFGTFAARLDDALNFVPAGCLCPASRSPPASSRTCGTTTSFPWAGNTAQPTKAPTPHGAKRPLPQPSASSSEAPPCTGICASTIRGSATEPPMPSPRTSCWQSGSCGIPLSSSRCLKCFLSVC